MGKESTVRKYNLALAAISCLFIVALHFPFLQADPDSQISWSRGANTDEGLYSMQVRNFINHGDLTFKNSDGLLKTPLFSATLYLPFKLFGTRLVVGRLTVLLISLLICWIILGYNFYYGALGFISIILVFTEYHIFHFFHFSLAELLSVSLIFLAVFLMANSDKSRVRVRDSILPSICITIAYFLKFQYVYSVLILPLALIINGIIHTGHRKVLFWQFLQTSAILSAGVLIYFVAWYIPNKEFYDFVVQDQVAHKFIKFSGFYDHLIYLKDSIFLKGYLKPFTLAMAILTITGIVLLFKRSSVRFSYLFVALACWFLVELHKLTLVYLPTRYLISFLFAMGMVMSVVLLELFMLKGRTWYLISAKVMLTLVLMSFIFRNASSYYETYKRRTFVIKETDDYFARYDFGKKPLMGSWAPSLSWKSRALTYPVWMNFMNDKDILSKYGPVAIIAEPDEEDSNQAYSLQGIDLNSLADSVKTVQVNAWTLKIYWLKQGSGN
jgi:hypothetical protein